MKFGEFADVLCCISDFSGTTTCSHVSAWMWNLLQHRHVLYSVRDKRDLVSVAKGLRIQVLHTASLRFRVGIGDSAAQALAGLKDVAALHTLTVDLRRNDVGDSGAQAFAGLKHAAALHTLSLYLGGNWGGASGAQALAGLKDAAALHTMTLDLRRNCEGDRSPASSCRAEGCRCTAYSDLGSWWQSCARQWCMSPCRAEGCLCTAYSDLSALGQPGG